MYIAEELDRFLPDKDAAEYETALKLAREKEYDLAIVHLKAVSSRNPDYLPAGKLLCLICMETGDLARAERIVTSLLEKYPGDTHLMSYRDEIEKRGGNSLKVLVREQEKREERERQEVIIPRYSEKRELLHDFFCIAGGIILGVLACMYLIFPSVKQQYITENNTQIMSYGDNLASNEVKIRALEAQIDELKLELEDTKSSLAVYTDKNGIMDSYKNMISVLTCYAEGDILTASKSFAKLEADSVKNSVYKKAYKSMKNVLESDGVTRLYTEGMSLYKKYKYMDAAKYFKECLKLKSDYTEVMYYLGLCYFNTQDRDSAAKYFYKLQKKYPETAWAKYAKNLMPYKETAPEE